MPARLAIFASGSGTNAENLMHYFKNKSDFEISVLFSNRADAYALQRARKFEIPTVVFSKKEFDSPFFLKQLVSRKIDFIILAGFLLKAPEYLVTHFNNRIINIHPALLPAYGGKGMYGSHVHEAVIASGDSVSGITIHLVNENYDEGRILFQCRCAVEPTDTPETLAVRIHKLEYEHFPRIIEQYIRQALHGAG